MRLIDTDVFINLSRGRLPKSTLYWDGSDCLSDITYMEFAQGCRSRQELQVWKRVCRYFQLLPVNEEISMRARHLIDQFALAQGMTSGDALIAATALTYGYPLVTGNKKHFQFISDLEATFVRTG